MKNGKTDFCWETCGHDNVVSFLQSSAASGKISHAYLFVGPAGLGKYTVAQKFVGSILCQGQNSARPCGDCFCCHQLERGVHPDVYEVFRQTDEKTGKLKKNISIDQVRDLKNRLQQGSMLNSYKVAIIDGAQALTAAAANGLLKLLEEPTPKTVIILIADSVANLPPTIASRCQQLNFFPVDTRRIEDFLREKTDSAVAQKIARLSYGRPGVAMSFLENKSLLTDYDDNIKKFFTLLGADLSGRFKLVDKLVGFAAGDETQNAERVKKLLADWQLLIRDFLLISSDNEFLVANAEYLPQIKKNSGNFDFAKIKNTLLAMNRAMIGFDYNVNSKLILENLIINL